MEHGRLPQLPPATVISVTRAVYVAILLCETASCLYSTLILVGSIHLVCGRYCVFSKMMFLYISMPIPISVPNLLQSFFQTHAQLCVTAVL